MLRPLQNLLLVICVLICGAVVYVPSASALWESQDGCQEFVVEVVTVLTGNCEDDESSESNNVCLEAAGFPVSTTPELLRLMQRQQAANEVIPRTEKQIERAWSEATAQLESKFTFQIATPKRRTRELSCSVFESSCDEEPTTPTLELLGGHGFGVDPTDQERRYIEPVSFDMAPNNPGLANAERSCEPLVPPPDFG